ncbi:MAG: hypothetical protein M0Z71_12470 [Nitrospiraceae bacterium]|nr:hypothetical protein [Nitrospiraceae bacterium]
MFLNHQTYEDLKNLIGEESTVTLANRYGGTALYLPKLDGSSYQSRGPQCLYNGLKDRTVRSLICSMRREGISGTTIIEDIKKRWPDDKDKWVTNGSLYRFFAAVRRGRMREFGIDEAFREI